MKKLTIALSGALVLGACDTKTCTEIGCSDAIDVAFGADGGHASGHYLIRVEADDLETECQVAIDYAAGLAGGGDVGVSDVAPSCSGDAGLAVEVLSSDHIEGLKIHGVWERVRIEVSRGGQLLLDESFEPSYGEVRPNGEGCDPTCRVAQHDTSLIGAP